MKNATNSPYQSDFGFKSPGFTVDAQGNIVATSISLSTSTDNLIGDFEFTDNGTSFEIVGKDGVNPSINLARGESYTLELSLSSFTFELVNANESEYVEFTINHSDGSTGNDAQGKSSGLLSFTIPQNYSDDTIIYRNVGTNIKGTINVIDPVGLFSSVNITDTVDSTSPETGSLLVTGGVGIKQNLTVGGELNISNLTVYNDSINVLASDSSLLGTIDNQGSSIPLKDTTITNTSLSSSTIITAPSQANDITNKTYVDSTVSALAIALGT